MAQGLIKTTDSLAAFILRLGLAIVIFPHGAQKVLGWFGGGGFQGTLDGMSAGFGLPVFIVILVMLIEFVGPLMLLFGLYTRIVAFSMLCLFAGIIFFAQLANGFFMNWGGQNAGEGFEYHLLVVAMSLALVSSGAGRWSADRKLMKGRH
ncbi:putative oxidoreductase [Anseongella ginsenosidimutans]|uniref:Putative oxidoreductase n=1 Tax=Anseongella ginsenosidimutans TaxID=496056 RepID=A0A4R3KX71_9SPHI|nr:DoxX family protein [Anseongella ginsenosidimutans]QEC51067.1 DoxX family protein [Anseongella ginsenosidimutans]TCS90275.1 putative oxidoreductase [Anseongella ginsenosidimutans]